MTSKKCKQCLFFKRKKEYPFDNVYSYCIKYGQLLNYMPCKNFESKSIKQN